MAGQLTAAAAATATNPSLLLPHSLLRPPSLRIKDLIPQRRVTFSRKKIPTFKALASSSLRKSATRLTAVSSPLSTDNHGILSLSVPKSRRSSSSTRPQAYIYHWSGFRIPANAEKPEWWWRTLSCIPYLIALQMSNPVYYLKPLLNKFELFENVIFYIPGAFYQLPLWFHILYSYLAGEVVVKNRDFPLIFRFHVMTGMLLEVALQIVWIASKFLPLIHFNGTLGMYYRAAVALTYIIITMHSIRCALLGTFSNIPVISESAFIRSLFRLGGFQRPF